MQVDTAWLLTVITYPCQFQVSLWTMTHHFQLWAGVWQEELLHLRIVIAINTNHIPFIEGCSIWGLLCQSPFFQADQATPFTNFEESPLGWHFLSDNKRIGVSLHGSPCQLVALPTSGWSVVNQYVRNWPINHDVTLQAFTSSFKGNRTFHFAICFFVTPH